MPAHLHDCHALRPLDAVSQFPFGQGPRQDGNTLVARRERQPRRRRAGGDACHPRHDLAGETARKPRVKIHEGAIEKGIPLAQHRHIVPRFKLGRDQGGIGVIGGLGRGAFGGHRDLHADFPCAGRDQIDSDGAGKTLLAR